MINLNNISKGIKSFMLWLITSNYGRFLLGIILVIFGGIFSPYGTIEFLSTDYEIFTYIVNTGVLIITGQFLWVVFMGLYLWIFNKSK